MVDFADLKSFSHCVFGVFNSSFGLLSGLELLLVSNSLGLSTLTRGSFGTSCGDGAVGRLFIASFSDLEPSSLSNLTWEAFATLSKEGVGALIKTSLGLPSDPDWLLVSN